MVPWARRGSVRIAWVAVCVVAACAGAARAQDSFLVIVHPENPVVGLSREEISELFLKERTAWKDGTEAQPVDLAGSSPVREDFSVAIHNRSSGNIRSYWQQQIFSGGKVPPMEVDGEAQVVEFVRSQRGAIGYVSAAADLRGVKAIGLVLPPTAVQRVPARYTAMARRFKVEGVVRLRLVVDAQGGVKDVEVLQGLKHGLNEQAIQAVKKWEFEPGLLDGQPVETTTEVTIRFTL